MKLRGVYIKLGQVLSVMGTFLPAYVKALEGLQDAVPPRRWSTIRRALRRGLGKDPEEAFATFDTTPIAAASLSQVHRAVMHDGERVAVKVLYPAIRAAMRVDMRVLRIAVWIYKRLFLRLEQLDRVIDQLQEMLERETDFENEARCIERMGQNFASDTDVILPRVVGDLSSKRVLTMTFMDGAKITNRESLSALGLDPLAVATKLVQTFYKSLFQDGFFHADPHPGNFFVQRGERGQPRLVILDLGSATEIRPHLVDGLGDVIKGFVTKDDAALLRGIETMGFVAESGDRTVLERTVRHYFQQILRLDVADFSNIEAGLGKVKEPVLDQGDVHELMRSIAYPLGWFYVERAALILFGVSSQLAPSLNFAAAGFPYVARFLAERAAKQRAGASGALAA
ncbi:MAG: AarF/ABC1/UbiB kinase family protein [Myxococcota bacterium]